MIPPSKKPRTSLNLPCYISKNSVGGDLVSEVMDLPCINAPKETLERYKMIFDFKEYFSNNIDCRRGQSFCETSKITVNNEYYCSCSNGEDDEESSDDGSDNFVIQRRMVLRSDGKKEVRTTKLGVALASEDSYNKLNSINK